MHKLWPCALLIVMAKAGLKGNCLRLNLKGSNVSFGLEVMRGMKTPLPMLHLVTKSDFDDMQVGLACQHSGAISLSTGTMHVSEQHDRSTFLHCQLVRRLA